MTTDAIKAKAETLIQPTAQAWLAPLESELRRLIALAETGTPQQLADAVRQAAKDAPELYGKLNFNAYEQTLSDLQAESMIMELER